MKLEIYVLVDNFASTTCKAEHGLSYVVHYDESVLFDTGQSHLFLDNAHQMELDMDSISTVVLSHGHYDHGNGLNFISNKSLILHPHAFTTRYSGKKKRYVGLNLNREQAKEKFNLIESAEPFKISENIWFLGEIPHEVSFEESSQRFYTGNGEKDGLLDDSGLVIRTPEGLFIISGCAHSGICNIITHARNITGEDRIYGIMGGFHLLHNDEKTRKTINFIKEVNPQVVLPAHCTALPALTLLHQEFNTQQVKAGNLYTFFK